MNVICFDKVTATFQFTIEVPILPINNKDENIQRVIEHIESKINKAFDHDIPLRVVKVTYETAEEIVDRMNKILREV